MTTEGVRPSAIPAERPDIEQKRYVHKAEAFEREQKRSLVDDGNCCDTDLSSESQKFPQALQAKKAARVHKTVQYIQRGMKHIDSRIGSLCQLARDYEGLLSGALGTKNAVYFQASRRYGMIRHAILKLNQEYDHLDLVSRNLPVTEAPSISIESYPDLSGSLESGVFHVEPQSEFHTRGQTQRALCPQLHAKPGEQAPPEEEVVEHEYCRDPVREEIARTTFQGGAWISFFRAEFFRSQAALWRQRLMTDVPDNLPPDIQEALQQFRSLSQSDDPVIAKKEAFSRFVRMKRQA